VSGVWAWLKKWWRVLAGALNGVFLLLVALGIVLWQVKKRQVGALQDQIAVSEATKDIAALRARREEVARQAGEESAEIAEIDQALAVNQRKIIDAYEGGTDLTAEEVADELARLGY